MQKVIINPSFGGLETGNINGNLIEKNYNLDISKMIFNNLINNGINAYLVRDNDITLNDNERLNIVDSYINQGDNVILLTIMLANGNDSGAEIIYALRDTDNLALQISNAISNTGLNVIKYYQLRDPNNTASDYYSIINNADNTESIIVSLGYVDNTFDNNFLLNNEDKLAKAISDAIINYLKKENIYIVKSGDTLYKIAKNYNISVDRLKEVNNLVNNNLSINQELLIPNEENTSSSVNNNYINYIVKSGDTLYKIARNYNTTVNTIKEINNLSSNNLSINQELLIPNNNNNNNYINYIVKSGDSLYKIARNYNTTVNTIKEINNLSSNNLSINQVLKIPLN